MNVEKAITAIPEEVQSLIGRAVVDEEFRTLLEREPEQVGREFGLDDIHVEFVKNMAPEIVEMANSLNYKIMKEAAGIIFCTVAD